MLILGRVEEQCSGLWGDRGGARRSAFAEQFCVLVLGNKYMNGGLLGADTGAFLFLRDR